MTTCAMSRWTTVTPTPVITLGSVNGRRVVTPVDVIKVLLVGSWREWDGGFRSG